MGQGTHLEDWPAVSVIVGDVKRVEGRGEAVPEREDVLEDLSDPGLRFVHPQRRRDLLPRVLGGNAG